MKTTTFIFYIFLVIILVNVVLYVNLSREPYSSYTELSTAILNDPSFQIIVESSYNDVSYQYITNPSSNFLNNPLTNVYHPINDPRITYKTDNYNMEYHDKYDSSFNYLDGTDIYKIGYYPLGSFRYGPKSFVPNYEDAIVLSSLNKAYNPNSFPFTSEYTLPIP